MVERGAFECLSVGTRWSSLSDLDLAARIELLQASQMCLESKILRPVVYFDGRQ